jgi:LacI family transcriptional regulator
MAAMHEAGVEPDPRWILQDLPEGLRGGQQAVRTFVTGGIVPTAILFNDDWVAMGGVYELARQGLKVPDDVSVIGYDNTAISEQLTPSLSSIDNREQQLMSLALGMLQERMNGLTSAPRQQVLPSYLAWRESCSRPATRALP